ncbi:MBL fold metallo-hydrolase [Sphingomonas hankookensis]|uniref:MBL fold metallo-hydrolase n=1 Tax=Sphingomonas hankookensis TaxID=563996 RepID=UPI001F5AB71B|nr:MBL fold metallo-hydrolase [Sphingomonas hankookensis]
MANSKDARPLLQRMRHNPIRSFLALAAILVLAAAACLAWSFAPARLELPRVEVGALPAASPPPGMSISALPTGTYETPAALAFRGGSWSDTRAFAATGILVRHPKGDLLIDTGFGKNVDRQLALLPSYQRSTHHLGVPIARQLTAARMPLHDIMGIIPTHTHWDHISGMDDLHGIPLMVTDAGHRFIASRAKGTEVLNGLGDVQYQQYAYNGGSYLGFPQSHDVYGDGAVVIVPAPGHTPDSIVVFVTLPSGKRYAFLGDLVWQTDGLRIPAEKPWLLRRLIGENYDETRIDLARIRAAIARYPQLTAVPAHDGRAFRSIALYPAKTR